MKQKVGYAMLAAPFLALAVAITAISGGRVAAIVFGGAFAIAAFISVGAWLVVEGDDA